MASGNSSNHKPLNILFVFSDQMHPFAMGCMDNPEIHTPNLDKLAGDGVLFRNAYSNCSLCTPFRANLFTGRYASQTGVFHNQQAIPEGERTVAACLNDGGYRTSYVGKWHLGATGNIAVEPELRAGFTEFIGYQCYNDYIKNVWFFDEDGVKTEYRKHRTDATTDIAIERLEGLAGERFALFVSYQNPHYPLQPDPQYEAIYAGKNLTKRPNYKDYEPYTQTLSPPSAKPRENDPIYQKYGGNPEEYLRLYYAMVSQLDANIGRLLDTLERLGLRGNTAVIFTSDHGDVQGSHGEKNKCRPCEESVRIPLIVRAPGGARNVKSNALVQSVDFFASCLDYACLPPEPRVAGASFAPLTMGEPQELNGPVYSEMTNWRMVREGNFKLVVAMPDFDLQKLTDLENDPYELNNLIDSAEHEEIRERLLERLRQFPDGE
jgi:arylsulfatase A-like enzyme